MNFVLAFLLLNKLVETSYETSYDLMEENLLYMISQSTTPVQVSSYLLNMLDNYPEEEEDIRVWSLLVNDYLLAEGLPPLEYRYRLSEQAWRHPTYFLRPEEEAERKRLVHELHMHVIGREDKDGLGAILEAKGRMLSNREEWEEFLADYSVVMKHEFPADPKVLEELEKSRAAFYNPPVL